MPVIHFNTAGGIVVQDERVLVLRSSLYDHLRLPKGHIEEGETARAAALREVCEETGLTDVTLGPRLATIDWVFHKNGDRIHKFTTFFLAFSERGDPVPRREEGITEAIWVRIDSVHERLSYENASRVVQAARAMLLEDEDPSTALDGAV